MVLRNFLIKFSFQSLIWLDKGELATPMERRQIFLFLGFVPTEKEQTNLLESLTNNLAAIADWIVQTSHHSLKIFITIVTVRIFFFITFF
jgi:hypothetical protein